MPKGLFFLGFLATLGLPQAPLAEGVLTSTAEVSLTIAEPAGVGVRATTPVFADRRGRPAEVDFGAMSVKVPVGQVYSISTSDSAPAPDAGAVERPAKAVSPAGAIAVPPRAADAHVMVMNLN